MELLPSDAADSELNTSAEQENENEKKQENARGTDGTEPDTEPENSGGEDEDEDENQSFVDSVIKQESFTRVSRKRARAEEEEEEEATASGALVRTDSNSTVVSELSVFEFDEFDGDEGQSEDSEIQFRSPFRKTKTAKRRNGNARASTPTGAATPPLPTMSARDTTPTLRRVTRNFRNQRRELSPIVGPRYSPPARRSLGDPPPPPPARRSRGDPPPSPTDPPQSPSPSAGSEDDNGDNSDQTDPGSEAEFQRGDSFDADDEDNGSEVDEVDERYEDDDERRAQTAREYRDRPQQQDQLPRPFVNYPHDLPHKDDVEWQDPTVYTEDTYDPVIPEFTAEGAGKLQFDPSGMSELDFFYKMFPEHLFHEIAFETNRYAAAGAPNRKRRHGE